MTDINNIHSDRDVIVGDQYNVTQVIQLPSFVPPKNLEKLRADYLEHLRRTYRALDFKGIPQLDALSRELLLEEVYVPLVARPEQPEGETWDRRLAGRKLDRESLPPEAFLGRAMPQAIISVPAYYNDNQRHAVKEAGQLAGFDVRRIVNEPTAAALAYGFNRGLDQKVLVYDLGGGTFDATLMKVGLGGELTTLGTDGDVELGGKDWDRRLDRKSTRLNSSH